MARNLGDRALHRWFARNVGLGSKQFLRVTRFRGALTLLRRRREVSGAFAALACGYADQPHMAREFREFAALAPTAMIARSDPILSAVASPLASE